MRQAFCLTRGGFLPIINNTCRASCAMCAQPLRRTKTCGAARTQGRLESAARGCKKQKKGISGCSAVGARSRAPPAAETARRKCWAAMRAMQGRAKAAAARHMATGSASRAAVKRQKKRISGCSAVGSAPHLGCGCRGFESRHSDQSECSYGHSDFYFSSFIMNFGARRTPVESVFYRFFLFNLFKFYSPDADAFGTAFG